MPLEQFCWRFCAASEMVSPQDRHRLLMLPMGKPGRSARRWQRSRMMTSTWVVWPAESADAVSDLRLREPAAGRHTLGSIVQALTEQEGRCDLIGREQNLSGRNGPRQAGQGQVQAAVKGHPRQRAL